jgi:hypothetical protein
LNFFRKSKSFSRLKDFSENVRLINNTESTEYFFKKSFFSIHKKYRQWIRNRNPDPRSPKWTPKKGKIFETACLEELSGGLLAKVWKNLGLDTDWIRIQKSLDLRTAK